MSIVKITESILSDIANAIRSKKNTNETYTPSNMATAIQSISTGHQPITINITQSANQTITVKPSVTWDDKISNSTISDPSYVTLRATITPDNGYNAGTLNQTNVTAQWGNTYSFSATPATEIGKLDITLAAASDTKEYDGTELVNDGWDLISGQLFENDEIYSVEVVGSQLNVGSSTNRIVSIEMYRDGEPIDPYDYYNITLVNGTLTITPWYEQEISIVLMGYIPNGNEIFPSVTLNSNTNSTTTVWFPSSGSSTNSIYGGCAIKLNANNNHQKFYYYSDDNETWEEIPSDTDFLPWWDEYNTGWDELKIKCEYE